MYMSANMYSGLTALLNVNTELTKYQTQVTTGKKISQASDGLAAYLTAQGYDQRATRLQTMNDGLTSVLSTVSAAKTGLDQVKKSLSDLRNTLKLASETQGQQAAQNSQQLSDSDGGNTQFSFALTARWGKNAANPNNMFAGQNSITADTAFVQADTSGKDPTASQSQVFIGNQAVREGMTFTFNSGGTAGKTWTFKIGLTGTDGVIQPTKDGTTAADSTTTTVYSIGQLLQGMRDKLGIDTAFNTNGNAATVTATYTGPSYAKDSYGNTDLKTPLGVSVSVDYVAKSVPAGQTIDNGYGAHETYDLQGNAGYMNVNAMFANVRGSNNNRINYIEDQKTLKVGNTVKTDYAAPINRTTFEKTSANAAYNDTQNTSFVGVQHNFKAAVDAKAADPSRFNAAKTYRQTMTALNNIVGDATSSGINLLMGSPLRATLNEDGTSQTFQITNTANNSMSFTSVALGLVDAGGNAIDAQANFATNNDTGGPGILTAIDKIDAAIVQIDSGMNQVATFQSVIQDRKDFNGSLVKMLGQATADLVGADATETAAKASSLQIQQSFAQSILASTKQSEQSLLQLLR